MIEIWTDLVLIWSPFCAFLVTFVCCAIEEFMTWEADFYEYSFLMTFGFWDFNYYFIMEAIRLLSEGK